MRNVLAIVAFAGVVLLAKIGFARTPFGPTEPNELFQQSDLIIIGYVIESSDAPDVIPEDRFTGQMVGVNSRIHVDGIIKGDIFPLDEITLFHWRFGPKSNQFQNGPMLLNFRAPGRKFLFFFKKMPDGRYEPTSGQIDASASAKHIVPPEKPLGSVPKPRAPATQPSK